MKSMGCRSDDESARIARCPPSRTRPPTAGTTSPRSSAPGATRRAAGASGSGTSDPASTRPPRSSGAATCRRRWPRTSRLASWSTTTPASRPAGAPSHPAPTTRASPATRPPRAPPTRTASGPSPASSSGSASGGRGSPRSCSTVPSTWPAGTAPAPSRPTRWTPPSGPRPPPSCSMVRCRSSCGSASPRSASAPARPARWSASTSAEQREEPPPRVRRMSMQMKAVSVFLRLAYKPRMATAERAQQRLAESKGSTEPPAGLRKRHDVSTRQVEGFPVTTVTPRGRTSRRAAVYLHGGAYVSEIAAQHWALISKLADAGVRVEVPHYGLAPQHTHREAYPLVTAVYRQLLEHVDAGDVTLAGDSAGGGLALGVAQTLAQEGLPQPRQLVLLSPWLDLTISNPDIPARRGPRPLAQQRRPAGRRRGMGRR